MARAKDWERRNNETSKAFEAFVIYRDLGHLRRLDSVAKTLGKSNTLIERWSAAHSWVERVVSYDNHMNEAEASGRRKVRQKAGVDWEKRELKGRNKLYVQSISMLSKVSAMLAEPLHDEVKENGRTVMKPRWNYAQAASLATAAAKLFELAIDDGLKQELDFDVTTASPEECRAWAERVKAKMEDRKGLL